MRQMSRHQQWHPIHGQKVVLSQQVIQPQRPSALSSRTARLVIVRRGKGLIASHMRQHLQKMRNMQSVSLVHLTR